MCQVSADAEIEVGIDEDDLLTVNIKGESEDICYREMAWFKAFAPEAP